jgi:alkylation response protein AidB-like acyl-CoA dehydrogenase
VRAALSYASEVAVEVVDGMAGLMSGEALRAEHPFERRVRDVHTLRHHAALYDRVYELTGRIMLGIDDDNPLV